MTGIQSAKQAVAAAPAEEAAAAPELSAPPSPTPNFYCLSKDHSARLVTVERFFYFAGEVHPPEHPKAGKLVLVDQGPGREPVPDLSKAPVCPVCGGRSQVTDPLTGRPRVTRVSAIPLEYDDAGDPLIPQAILDIAARAGEA